MIASHRMQACIRLITISPLVKVWVAVLSGPLGIFNLTSPVPGFRSTEFAKRLSQLSPDADQRALR